MAIDNIARGLAASLIGTDGKIASDKLPIMPNIEDTSGFVSVGRLNDVSQVAGKTAEEILLMMLFGVVNPTLTDPSLTVSLASDSVVIAGRECALSGNLSFSRGSIEPAYTTSGYRSGFPIFYQIGDYEEAIRATSLDFSIVYTPTVGDNDIICIVNYEAGEQPVNSIGEPFATALPAGSISTSFTIKGVYQPYLASGEEINFIYFTDDDGEGYQFVSASENFGTKQTFTISKSIKVIGIKQIDPITQQWVWLGASPEASLSFFDTTIITGDSLGEQGDYVVYTHNGSTTGERQLRFYVQYN